MNELTLEGTLVVFSSPVSSGRDLSGRDLGAVGIPGSGQPLLLVNLWKILDRLSSGVLGLSALC